MISLLMARVEQHRFAFRLEDVREVLLLPQLEHRAGDMKLIEGWLRLGEEKFPTLSLAGILGLGEEPPDVSDHLVLTNSSPTVAWRVRRVEGLAQLSWEDLKLVEHTAEATPCYVAQFDPDDGPTTLLLNVSGLLMVEEKERLKCVEEKRSQRLEKLKGPTPRV